MRCVGDHNGAGFGGRLYSRRDIGRVAKDIGLLARAGAYHYRARIDADPRGQLWVRQAVR